MIVWGGVSNTTYYADGGRYNPAGNSWTAMTTSGAPAGRVYHTAVWTGSEMIVWGGAGGSILNDGGRYNPAGNSWTLILNSLPNTPAARYDHTAVWTGSEMIVWGGFNLDALNYALNDGGRYNPAANSWAPVSTNGAPGARYDHTAVWTGSEMIVWGGSGASLYLNDGGRYNPAGNSWTVVTTNGAPAARRYHTAVWTGSEMTVWGGESPGSYSNDGGRYNPAGNSWMLILNSLPNTPAARPYHTAVWTGSEMIIWGGVSGATYLSDGARYKPAGNSWAPILSSLPNTPAARYRHTAMWTGSEMIVWGGSGSASYFNDGGRYNPAENSWTPMTTAGAPAARHAHTAVWTGSEMIAWGGLGNSGYFNDTFSYTPGHVMYLYQRP
jgi:N-acetylneuraminic acid mutarotase